MCKEASTVTRVAAGEKPHLENLKLLDIVQIFLAALRKLIAPLGVPSWLRARKKHA